MSVNNEKNFNYSFNCDECQEDLTENVQMRDSRLPPTGSNRTSQYGNSDGGRSSLSLSSGLTLIKWFSHLFVTELRCLPSVPISSLILFGIFV